MHTITFSETVRLQSRVPYFSALETIDIVAFFVLCIVLLEAVRRTLGWNLIIFIAIFVLYALFGQYLPRSSGYVPRAFGLWSSLN